MRARLHPLVLATLALLAGSPAPVAAQPADPDPTAETPDPAGSPAGEPTPDDGAPPDDGATAPLPVAGTAAPADLAEPDLPPVDEVDLDTLVVPRPAPPEARHPEEDIRRLLRPERSILEATERLDQHIRDRDTRVTWQEGLEARLDADLTRATADFEALTAARDAERAIVRQRLATMIRIRAMPATRILLRSKSHADYSARLEALERLYETDRRRVVAYREQLAAWNTARVDLARRRQNLANTQETLAYLRQELAWDREERAALVSAVREQPEFYAEYAREIEALDDVVAELARGWTDPRYPRLYTAETKGGLAPPVRNGDVVGRYGIRKHPKFGTTSVSRGIEMVPNRPTERDEARAIYWGYVAYTGWIRGLGRVVVLDHTLGYVSIYAHLDLIEVAVGQKVKTGEAVGTLGDTGSFYGTRLYLELRKDGKAVDPLPWFKR